MADTKIETIEPVGLSVLICKDEDKKVTKGGIELPDSVEIPTLTGRVTAISARVERDDDFPIKEYDKVLFHPANIVPVDFDHGNKLYIVPVENVVAIIRKERKIHD